MAIAPVAVEELVQRVQHYGEAVKSPLDAIAECRDPKDDYVLAAALAASADVIVTEDQDLLVLNPWRGIRIMRLFEFLQENPLPA